LNPRSQQLSNSFLLAALHYLHLKGQQLWKERENCSNPTGSTFLPNFSALPHLCYPYPSPPSSASSLITIMIARLFTLVFSIYNQEEEPIRKMVPFAEHLYIVDKNRG
jgi:hypothetical protein